MNTDICFQISAPASLSLFGEHAKNKLRASIDLRTTLIFQVVPASLSNDIEINFPQINLLYKISLDKFLIFYNHCVKNTELLHERVLKFTFQYESTHHKIFLQIFYYLLVRITYEEQIEIKTFSILLTTQLISNGEFISLASLKVCLAACLLNWSRLQKGAYSTFDKPDLKRIWVYAKFCEKIAPESDLIDLMVCTYGSLMKYEREQNMYKRLCLPSILFTKTILIVDSNQTQDVKVQKQRIAKFMNTFPELANSVLNNIDIVTNIANDIFQEIFDICKDNELSIKIKNDYLLQQDKALEVSHNMNFIKKCCSVVCLCVAAFSVSYFS